MQKRNAKKIKSGNNDAGAIFYDQNNYGVHIQSITEPQYASYFASIDAPAKSLCFSDRSLDDQESQLIPPANIFYTYTSNEYIRSAGYRENWYFPSGTSLNLPGYFIYRLEKQWSYIKDGNNWINNCAILDRRDSIGKGAYTIVKTSRHINALNDPGQTTYVLGGSISYWIINTLKADTIDKQKKLFPKLVFLDDEPIYFFQPQPSPLVFPSDISYSVSRGSATNVKVMDVIGAFIQNKSTIVLTSDFTITLFESSDPTIAKITTPIYSSVDTITFIATGTFTLTGTQRFYQSYPRQISYSKNVFTIIINLTVED
jgi:hypothetical protein